MLILRGVVHEMLVVPIGLLFFPFFFSTSLITVYYTKHSQLGMSEKEWITVFGLTLMQFVVASLLLIPVGLVMISLGLIPLGGGEISNDLLYLNGIPFTSIASLVLVNFAYFIYRKISAVK